MYYNCLSGSLGLSPEQMPLLLHHSALFAVELSQVYFIGNIARDRIIVQLFGIDSRHLLP